MTMQDLLDLVSSYKSFMVSFLEEYREELVLPQGEHIIPFLADVEKEILLGNIPESMCPRIKKMIDGLGIEALINTHRALSRIHDLERFQVFFKDIIINCFFAERTFGLFKAIGFVNSNVVLIGANGSGKTTFANLIRDELERTETGIVIPAQKLLIFPTFTFLPTYTSAYSAYNNRQKEVLDDKETYTANQGDSLPYDITKKYGSEMRLLLSALIGERLAKRNRYCSDIKDGEIVDTKAFKSVLDEVIDLWNDFIGHRELFSDDSGNLQIRYGSTHYPAYKMSDGEREILYVVGRVLLAKESSLIIVDEPELHLHKSILNKLWDCLEKRRKDCMFVYLTHDIEFASSRSARKCWLKAFSPGQLDEWDIELINDGVIPEELLMMILGSRKRILFCEGKKSSLDCQVFEALFHDYTIVPVESCKRVIDYTRAFNQIERKYSEAIGIIDSDFRTKEQLEKLKTENVFSYSVSEIENLFLVEDFIKGFAEYKHEELDFSDIKGRILALFEKSINQQASLFVAQRINEQFKESHVKSGQTKDEITKNYSDFTSRIDIEKWFAERKEELEKIVSSEDYEKAIMVYNNKGLHLILEKSLGLSSFNSKALDYLRNSDKAKEILRFFFPREIQS